MRRPRLSPVPTRTASLAPALLAGLVGLVPACRGNAPPPAPPPAPIATVALPPVPAALTPAQIAARATPAVVSIRSPNTLGTGFVVRKDGWIATNLHVIAGARELRVSTTDGNVYPNVDVH